MRALIVDEGNHGGALAVVRELGRAGWTVGVGSSDPPSPASQSRFCSRWHRLPRATEDLDGFVSALNAASEERAYDVVFGSDDAEVLALSYVRDRITPLFPYGPHDAVIGMFDKLSLAERAAHVGINAPYTVPATEDNLASFPWPAIVKTRLHWNSEAGAAPARLPAALVSNVSDARVRADAIRREGGAPILQQVIDGKLRVFAVLMDRTGVAVSSYFHRTVRQWPPDLGVSARAISAPVDRDLRVRVERMLSEVGWFGFASVQFLETGDGALHAIDFNGRMFGATTMTAAAGVSFHDYWARVATGRDAAISPEGRAGVHYQEIDNDLRWIRQELSLGRGLPGWLRWSFSSLHPYWQLSDPRPGLMAVRAMASRKLRRRQLGLW